MIGIRLALSVGAATLLACASSKPRETTPQYTIVKGVETAPQTGGIPPDKEAEVQLVLQQREVSTRKCYQDVLNERENKQLEGTVKLIITLDPSGRATDVKPAGGTLGDREVETCLVETIKKFEFPQLTQAGEVQYEFRFRPAY
jgi:TonB family protein